MTVYRSTAVGPSRAQMLATAILTPDSPDLPYPELRIRETRDRDGSVTFTYDGLVVGFTGRVPTGPDDFELVWMTTRGEHREFRMRGARAAADRVRRAVMREVGSHA